MTSRALVTVICEQCRSPFQRKAGAIKYHHEKHGRRMFCSADCRNAAHKTDTRTPEQRKADKAEYDRQYRAKNREMLKAKKAAYHKETYDPWVAHWQRRKRMPQHVEYCRRPEYRAKKAIYDQEHRAKKFYGDFAEAFLTLQSLEREIDTRATRTEVYAANGTLNKSIQRKREYGTNRS